MRFVILAPAWANTLDCGARELALAGHELLIVHGATMEHTNYDALMPSDYAEVLAWTDTPAFADVARAVKRFDPDVALMYSWHERTYRKVMRLLGPSVLRIMLMDNVWLAKPKQWLGRLTSPIYLHPLFDAAMVPSDQSEFFARRLGFRESRIIRGAYTGDVQTFACPPHPGHALQSRRRFVTALRLVEHKGADVLAEAYAEYRAISSDPWNLEVVGMGPLGGDLAPQPGVTMHGFLQQRELAALMRSSSCFVNPARVDPYAIVIHEAAAASLPLIATTGVGAGPSLIQDGYNGWIVPAGDPSALALTLGRVSGLSAERLQEMSTISHNLASRITPHGWARNLAEECQRLRQELAARR